MLKVLESDVTGGQFRLVKYPVRKRASTYTSPHFRTVVRRRCRTLSFLEQLKRGDSSILELLRPKLQQISGRTAHHSPYPCYSRHSSLSLTDTLTLASPRHNPFLHKATIYGPAEKQAVAIQYRHTFKH